MSWPGRLPAPVLSALPPYTDAAGRTSWWRPGSASASRWWSGREKPRPIPPRCDPFSVAAVGWRCQNAEAACAASTSKAVSCSPAPHRGCGSRPPRMPLAVLGLQLSGRRFPGAGPDAAADPDTVYLVASTWRSAQPALLHVLTMVWVTGRSSNNTTEHARRVRRLELGDERSRCSTGSTPRVRRQAHHHRRVRPADPLPNHDCSLTSYGRGPAVPDGVDQPPTAWSAQPSGAAAVHERRGTWP
jgi:hypothetical protein